MSPVSLKKLKALLIEHEGFKLFPYEDTTGNLTIGVGRNLKGNGMRQSEVLNMLDNDVDFFASKLASNVPSFPELDDTRKIVLVDMCFNLGLKGFLTFKNMLSAIKNKDWDVAAFHILKSKAYSQAPNRYKQLAEMMKTGEMHG